MRLLVVEDDRKIASFVASGLRQAGFAVDVAEDGEAGFDLAASAPYNVAVIDIMLPKLDGLTLIERLRLRKIMTPVIILSAKRSVDDRVKGLQRGGNDYLTKPFAFSELLARVHALVRRATGAAESTRKDTKPPRCKCGRLRRRTTLATSSLEPHASLQHKHSTKRFVGRRTGGGCAVTCCGGWCRSGDSFEAFLAMSALVADFVDAART